MNTATVILFKPSGKYHTAEEWIIPDSAVTPADMRHSPDFRRISGGAVLVPEQEPWGFPHLLPAEASEPRDVPELWRVELNGTDDSQARDMVVEVGIAELGGAYRWEPIETFLFRLACGDKRS